MSFGALAFVACTGGDDPAPTQSTASDASANDVAIGVDATSDALLVFDAGPDAEQDPNVYPSQHSPIPQVDNWGGPVLDHAKLVTVTFARDPLRDSLRTFTHQILTTTWWKATLGSFGFADGMNGGDFELDDVMSNKTTTDDDFHTYVAAQIKAGKLPQPDAQSLFIFYLPRNATIDTQGRLTCRDNGGYHSSFFYSIDSGDAGADAAVNVVDLAYAIIPRCGGFSDATFAASHEIAEAATDPTPGDDTTYYLRSNDAWIPTSQGTSVGGEVGDICWPLTYDESGYQVQRIWSNSAAKASKNPCQPASKPYFGAAVRTTPKLVAGFKVDGHLSVKRGESLDAMIDFFSEAPLAHDATLEVGVASNFGFDSLPAGVTASLSRTQAHNGNAIAMRITADATAATGIVHLVVRSTLDPGDYNDWPVILTVK